MDLFYVLLILIVCERWSVIYFTHNEEVTLYDLEQGVPGE